MVSAEAPQIGQDSQDAQERAGFTIWLTGLSGAGKSTIARILERELATAGRGAEVLDGDVIRAHLSSELGFSKADRDTQVRRIGWLCQLLNRHGVVTIVAAISPYRETRDEVRATLPRFLEVYVECPIDKLAERDPKGLYKRALAGEIAHFTGVSDPNEPPLSPDVVCRTDGTQTAEESATAILAAARQRGFLP
jgi:adenylyl-sulfate kinase